MKTHLKIFKALSDRSRLRIVKMLEVKPMCVCEITSVLELAPSTVSKHLSLLQEAGLVEAVKDGRWVDYALSSGFHSPAIKNMLEVLKKTLAGDRSVIEDQKRARRADRTRICGLESGK